MRKRWFRHWHAHQAANPINPLSLLQVAAVFFPLFFHELIDGYERGIREKKDPKNLVIKFPHLMSQTQMTIPVVVAHKCVISGGKAMLLPHFFGRKTTL